MPGVSASNYLLRQSFAGSKNDLLPSMETHLPMQTVFATLHPTRDTADHVSFRIGSEHGQILRRMWVRVPLKVDRATTNTMTAGPYRFPHGVGNHVMQAWTLRSTNDGNSVIDKGTYATDRILEHVYDTSEDRLIKYQRTSIGSDGVDVKHSGAVFVDNGAGTALQRQRTGLESQHESGYTAVIVSAAMTTTGDLSIDSDIVIEIPWYGSFSIGNALPIQHLSDFLDLDVALSVDAVNRALNNLAFFRNAQAVNYLHIKPIERGSVTLTCEYLKMNPFDFQAAFPYESPVTWYTPMFVGNGGIVREVPVPAAGSEPSGVYTVNLSEAISDVISYFVVSVTAKELKDVAGGEFPIPALHQLRIRAGGKRYFTTDDFLDGQLVLETMRDATYGRNDRELAPHTRRFHYVLPCTSVRHGYHAAGYGNIDAGVAGNSLFLDFSVVPHKTCLQHMQPEGAVSASAVNPFNIAGVTQPYYTVRIDAVALNTTTYASGRLTKFANA